MMGAFRGESGLVGMSATDPTAVVRRRVRATSEPLGGVGVQSLAESSEPHRLH